MTNAEKIVAIRETAEAVGGEVRKNYSGRGMYGTTCYGVDCDDFTRCIEEAASRGLRGSTFDSMGKGWIVYWPTVQDEAAQTGKKASA